MSEPNFQLPSLIELVRCETGDSVSASILKLSRESGRDLIDNVWWNGIDDATSDPKDQPDFHWRWREILSRVQNKPAFKAVGLQTDDNQLQAAMIYRVDFKSQVEKGKFSVYVDRLATAPKNRIKLVKQPVFQGGGNGLLVFAAAHSYFLGQEGRISLVPIANLDWYERKGFVETDMETNDGRIYELPRDRGIELLKERALLDE